MQTVNTDLTEHKLVHLPAQLIIRTHGARFVVVRVIIGKVVLLVRVLRVVVLVLVVVAIF